jgi:hypothetical protein
MTAQPGFVQPPSWAVWLVNLFTPAEEAESIQGDLLEEFSHIASKAGVAAARSWYWRQTVKTVAYLSVTGFRIAPWSSAAAVVGGFLLLGFVSKWCELGIFAVLHRYRVFDHYFKVYVFVATDGMRSDTSSSLFS